MNLKKHCVISIVCFSLLCLCLGAQSVSAAEQTPQTPTDLATEDEFFMAQALDLARLSIQHGNQPFGAVLVKHGRMAARAENTAISDGGVYHHAEMNVIHKAMRDLGLKSLEGHTLYASTEPCVMCCGAIFHSKVDTVVYGASQAYLGTLIPDYCAIDIRRIISFCRKKLAVRGPVMQESAERILADYVNAEKHKRANQEETVR